MFQITFNLIDRLWKIGRLQRTFIDIKPEPSCILLSFACLSWFPIFLALYSALSLPLCETVIARAELTNKQI